MNHIDLHRIELYHIVHIDKLSSILSSGTSGLLMCDNEVQKLSLLGTTIGMPKIKERRMYELTLHSYPDLHVGDCVPFHFCPRSIMLYMFYQRNHPELAYRGGQEPIVHLVFNMMDVIEWANKAERRWAFTDSNAGSYYFNDFCNLLDINKLDWNAIYANSWHDCKDKKQAEFLVEKSVPWNLVNSIGIYSFRYYNKVESAIASAIHKPPIQVKPEWYY